MINKQNLSILFKCNDIEYNKQYKFYRVNKKRTKIMIHKSETYDKVFTFLGNRLLKRKHCGLLKIDANYCNIYFHEDYITYILRQKIINTLLNDE